MRVLQDLVLLSLLLLSISKVYSQEDKKTKELFNSGGYISDGYALDRNQVRFNQSSDFVFHYIPGGDRLTCITSKQASFGFEMIVGIAATAFGVFFLISPQSILGMIFAKIGRAHV